MPRDLPLAFALALSLVSSLASGVEKLQLHGYAEVAPGVSIPVSDGNYKNFADPSFKFSLRGGVELWLFKRIGFAPEAQIDFIAVNTNDGTFQNAHIDFAGVRYDGINASYGRYRFLIGGRFLFDFGIGAAYARFLVGADYLTGSESETVMTPAGTLNHTEGFSSTAFTLQPGVGVLFRFAKYFQAGMSFDAPVAFHNFNNRDEYAIGNASFTSVDIDILGVFGFRFPPNQPR